MTVSMLTVVIFVLLYLRVCEYNQKHFTFDYIFCYNQYEKELDDNIKQVLETKDTKFLWQEVYLLSIANFWFSGCIKIVEMRLIKTLKMLQNPRHFY